MSFAAPWFLLALLIVPLALVYAIWVDRRRARYAVAFTNLDVLASVVGRRRAWRRWVPVALFVLALAAAGTALARPKATVRTPIDRATIVLLVDVSGSMRADDVKPTRLGAAQAAMETFLTKVPKKMRVGLVSFSSEPNIIVLPTTDRSQMLQGLQVLEPDAGTALGDGLDIAVKVVKSSIGNAPRGRDGKVPGAIILLSDGAQTRGTLQPLQAAAEARAAGIPVYTVALGTDHGTLPVQGFGGFGFGGAPGRLPVRPDPAILKAISEATGGVAYQAQTASKATQVYKVLGSSVITQPEKREVSSWFVGAAAALLLASLAAAAAVGGRLP